ncbi:MAG: signal peptidase I, partial [Xanthomonas perforans]|nr:signal peptidase I [Xanthomonas perforans]
MKWFEIILVVLTLGSGFIWLLDKLFLAKRRAARAGLLDSEPAIIDYSRAFFPVLAVVLILRSFVAEPYKIPSSSMMPNLLIGDFILVNKFAYGFRLPITNTKIVPFGEPSRGDVVVFHFPGHSDNDPAKGENFIKRVIGVPGDTVVFEGDGVILNGEPLKYDNKGIYAGHKGQGEGANLLVEHLPGRTHTVLETDYP